MGGGAITDRILLGAWQTWGGNDGRERVVVLGRHQEDEVNVTLVDTVGLSGLSQDQRLRQAGCWLRL